MKLNNPFIVYGYKGPEYFCDRAKETEKICSALRGERNVTLIAPRRIGKTGLIKHVFNRIEQEEPDTRCFYIDIFPTKNTDQFVQMLATAVIGRLDTLSQSAMRRIQEFFSSWRPKFSFDQVTGLPSVTLDIQPSESHDSLSRIFEYMRRSGRRCYIAIDEFQQILNYPDRGTEALIRSSIQFLPNVYFIFSGSRQHMMQQMFMSSNRPFFQSSMVMTIEGIDKDEYLSFANRLLHTQGRTVDRDTFYYIYELCGGITWYVQAVLHAVYEHNGREIDCRLIDDVVVELIEEQSEAYQNYCAWLTDNQLLLLKAIADEGSVASPLSRGFIVKHRLPATSSVKTALKALCDKQLVGRSIGGYAVSDRFFAMWLSKLCP